MKNDEIAIEVMRCVAAAAARKDSGYYSLRRCKAPLDVLLLDIFYSTKKAVQEKGYLVHSDEVLAQVLMFAVSVDINTDKPAIGKALALAKCSEIRFRRLASQDDFKLFVRELARVVTLVKQNVSTVSVLTTVLDWADDKTRQSARQKMAQDFYTTKS